MLLSSSLAWQSDKLESLIAARPNKSGKGVAYYVVSCAAAPPPATGLTWGSSPLCVLVVVPAPPILSKLLPKLQKLPPPLGCSPGSSSLALSPPIAGMPSPVDRVVVACAPCSSRTGPVATPTPHPPCPPDPPSAKDPTCTASPALSKPAPPRPNTPGCELEVRRWTACVQTDGTSQCRCAELMGRAGRSMNASKAKNLRWPRLGAARYKWRLRQRGGGRDRSI